MIDRGDLIRKTPWSISGTSKIDAHRKSMCIDFIFEKFRYFRMNSSIKSTKSSNQSTNSIEIVDRNNDFVDFIDEFIRIYRIKLNFDEENKSNHRFWSSKSMHRINFKFKNRCASNYFEEFLCVASNYFEEFLCVASNYFEEFLCVASNYFEEIRLNLSMN